MLREGVPTPIYDHDGHAGNHADVLKHGVLSLLLERTRQRPGPCLYAETHAGAGVYEIEGTAGGLTPSAARGIGRLWPERGGFPELAAYWEVTQDLNPTGGLARYPGSPWLASRLLRADDRLRLFELEEQTATRLKGLMAGDPRVEVVRGDGLACLPAELPRCGSQGLVLIDPPYSDSSEWEDALDCMIRIGGHWPGGVIALWYARLAADAHRPKALPNRVRRCGQGLLQIEIDVKAWPGAAGMTGSGMLILNSPDGLESVLMALLPRLAVRLAQAPEGWRFESWRLQRIDRDG